MKRRSLRGRLIVGAILWTIGTALVVNHVSLVLIHTQLSMGVLHYSLMGLMALGVLGAALWQVNSGLSPLRQLRARLGEVRDGSQPRVTGRYPSEVEPLVEDLNALLQDREERVGRALAKAGDLAHGLKTPLAVLAQEAERAERAGQTAVAATLHEQVERMRRQIEYHLAHARAAASRATPQARCVVAESAEGLARTMKRLYVERDIEIVLAVPEPHRVQVQREDLDEMLGNLLDNACKWAKSRVSLESTESEGMVVVRVDDDGPGIEPALREAVLKRGVRADQAAAGSGFGLAIVRDLAELYGGTIELSASPDGGVRARLRLPAA
ncbi:MAG TPA: HAMP domain-containing sensor histidine kinase [Candidatus Eisenbacteria bacterium]|nr:HAMP domain-containing sensor histidine kinase [Candidatus Eisenbacteria bacterium]